jgi:hypothetical protein
LEVVVSFIYTGKLGVVKECAVELLEDHQLLDEVKSVLIEEAKQADPFQELFYIWNSLDTWRRWC